MSYCVLLTNKLRLASAAIASVMLATLIFPSAYVLADSTLTGTGTSDTTAAAPAASMPATLTSQATATDATATNGIAVTDHSTNVSASDVATTLAHDGGVLAASDQTKTTSDSDAAIKAVTAGASVDVPKDPSKGVSLGTHDGAKLDIQLPNADDSENAKQIAPGTVAYPDTNGSASAVQATENGGVRMLTVIDNPNAPTEYNYRVTVPDGGQVILTNDGGATVVDGDGNVIVSVAKPWAHDATGRTINTYFTTDGTTLVQHVEHNVPGVAYPVTADPWWNPFSWFKRVVQVSRQVWNDPRLRHNLLLSVGCSLMAAGATAALFSGGAAPIGIAVFVYISGSGGCIVQGLA